MTPDKATLYTNMKGSEIIPTHKVKEKLANMAMGGVVNNFNDQNMVNAINRIPASISRLGRSSQVNSVRTTRRGRQEIRKHESFLNSQHD